MATRQHEDTTSSTSVQTPAKQPQHLDPSPLGTKEYWSSLYTTDLSLRQGTVPSHTGTTWFDDANAEQKTVHYLSTLLPAKTSPGQPALSPTQTTFLDLGTGNGSLLCALRKHGWSGPMVGVDYADSSIALARDIWNGISTHGWTSSDNDNDSDSNSNSSNEATIPAPSTTEISFHTLDILTLASADTALPSWTPSNGFDIVLDKGTFDAVSLSADTHTATGRRAAEVYASTAKRFLKKPHGQMLVTSCNWTASELEAWFCAADGSVEGAAQDGLVLLDRLPYRTFRFGGREGSVVVGLVFGWKS